MNRTEISKFFISGLNTVLITALGWFYISTSNSAEAERFDQRIKLNHVDSLLTVILAEQKVFYLLDNSAHEDFEKRIDSLERDNYKFSTLSICLILFSKVTRAFQNSFVSNGKKSV